MTKTKIGEQQEDFIEQLLGFINNGQSEAAIEKLKSIDGRSNRFDAIYRLLEATKTSLDTWKLRLSLSTLNSLASDRARARNLARNLARDLARDLARASDLARDLARDLAHARNLARNLARDLARDLAHARDLARDLARDRASASDRASDLARDRVCARDLVLDLTSARASASDLARDLASAIEDFEAIAQIVINLLNIIPIRKELADEIEFRYQNRLAHIYDEISHLQQQETSPILVVIAEVIWDELQNLPIPITFTGEQGITTATLLNEIAPYLKALRDIQEVHDRLLNKEFVEPKIIEIHNPSPASLLKDFADAIRTLVDVFDFRKWKDESNARTKSLTEQDLNNEAIRKDIDYEQRRRQIEMMGDEDERIKKLKILDEGYKQERIETDQKREGLRAQRLENIKASIDLADTIYERWGVKSGLDDMGQDLTEQLIAAYVVIKESPRQLQLGHRPTRVPEFDDD